MRFTEIFNLQEQDDDTGAGGGGSEPIDRKRYVQQQLDERYKPRQVREFLARYGDKAEVALEHALKGSDEMIERLMKRQAELEYDLKAAQTQVKSEAERVKQVEQERDQARTDLEAHTTKERQATIAAKLKDKFGDDVLVRRHIAYLNMDGYTVELDGDRLMLRQGDKRHNFDTIVNDAFYERYSDAKPGSDTPLAGSGNPPKADPPSKNGATSAFDPKAMSDLYGAEQERLRKFTQIPGVRDA